MGVEVDAAGWLPILLAVATGSVAVTRFLPWNRRQVDAAREAVQATRSRVRRDYHDLDARWTRLRNEALVAVADLADGDGFARQLEGETDMAQRWVDWATEGLVALDTRWDPATLEGIDALNDAGQRWQELARGTRTGLTRLDELQQTLEEMAAARDSCARILRDIDDRMTQARHAVEITRTNGYDVAELHLVLDRATGDVDRGRVELEANRLAEATKALERAADAVERATGTARRMPELHHTLLQRLTALRRQVGDADRTVQRIVDTVEGHARRFVTDVWDAVADAPAQARERRDAARADLVAAEAAMADDVQRFLDAEQSMDAVDADLEQLEWIRGGVATFEADLRAVIAEYPRAHAAARDSIARARAFMDVRHGDVNPGRRANLDRAAQVLADAERIAADGRGDPQDVIDRLGEVIRFTDQVLHGARSDAQQRDAYRTHVARLVRDAQRSVRRAHSAAGFGLIGWGARAKVSLSTAEDALREANAVLGSDPSRAEYLALQAGDIAAQILHEHRRRSNGPQIFR